LVFSLFWSIFLWLQNIGLIGNSREGREDTITPHHGNSQRPKNIEYPFSGNIIIPINLHNVPKVHGEKPCRSAETFGTLYVGFPQVPFWMGENIHSFDALGNHEISVDRLQKTPYNELGYHLNKMGMGVFWAGLPVENTPFFWRYKIDQPKKPWIPELFCS
jgi:hypothetical protein